MAAMERGPPVPSSPPAAAPVPPSGGWGRPSDRAGEGCSRRADEDVVPKPCAVALDHEAARTWIYPSECSPFLPAFREESLRHQ